MVSVRRSGRLQVADELVQEYFESIAGPAPGDTAAREKQQYDMKNIRRRVYDALNVLMAMNIIEKEKKEIRWVGLPTSSIQVDSEPSGRLGNRSESRKSRFRGLVHSLYQSQRTTSALHSPSTAAKPVATSSALG